jgi:hypothetical protein
MSSFSIRGERAMAVNASPDTLAKWRIEGFDRFAGMRRPCGGMSARQIPKRNERRGGQGCFRFVMQGSGTPGDLCGVAILVFSAFA